MWAFGREGEAAAQIVVDFERRHPDLRVRVQQIPWSAAHEKLLTAFVGDVLPDVVQVGNTWIPELVALGALEPLDDWVARSQELPLGDFFPGILDTNTVDGALHGIPWYVDTRVLFLREDLLSRGGVTQPLRTWEEWHAAMAKVRTGPRSERHAILLPITDWRPPVILALQLGAELLRDGDRYGNFESDAFRRAFSFYVGLFRDDLAPRGGAAQVANLYQDFARGYFAFFLSGPWDIGELTRRLPEELDRSWSTAPLPGPGSEYPGASLAGGASLSLVRSSPRKDAAWMLIEFLSTPSRQVALHRLTGDLPARRSAWHQAALERDRHARAFWLQLQNLRSTPKIPEWERVASKISQAAEAAIRGERTIDQALAMLDGEVDRLLEKRRWLLARAKREGVAAAGGLP